MKTWINEPLALAIAVAVMGSICLWAARTITHGQAAAEPTDDEQQEEA